MTKTFNDQADDEETSADQEGQTIYTGVMPTVLRYG